MRTRDEILAVLESIRADERMNYKSANVFVNAPLALIQVEGEAKIAVLEWMLGERDWCGGSFRVPHPEPVSTPAQKPRGRKEQ